MKKKSLYLTLAILAYFIPLSCAVYAQNRIADTTSDYENNYENNCATDGMAFDVANVVEEFEDCGGWIIYTDVDAGMYECEIAVDDDTYRSVLEAIYQHIPLTGTLEYSHTEGREPVYKLTNTNVTINFVK